MNSQHELSGGIMRHVTLPRALAVLVAGGVLAYGSCEPGKDSEQPVHRLLSAEEVAEACEDSETRISFRGSDHRENYATVTSDEYGGDSVASVVQQFYPRSDEEDAIDSLRAANPGIDITDSSSGIPEGHMLTLAISSFDQVTLPAGQKLGELGEQIGFDKEAMACVNGLDANSEFDSDTRVIVPRQIDSPEGLKVNIVQPGDTYTKIAQENNLPIEQVTPENLRGHNLVPPEKLMPGDLIYIRSGEVVNPEELRRTFLETYRPMAEMVQEKYGLPWQAVLAQAALETGYGTSELAKNANNFHGLKFNDEEYVQGEPYYKNTIEEVPEDALSEYEGRIVSRRKLANGNYEITVQGEAFQSFPDEQAGFLGYGEHIVNRLRGEAYRDARGVKDSSAYIDALVDDTGAAYATDSTYATKVSNILNVIDETFIDSAQDRGREDAPPEDLKNIFDSYPANQRVFAAGENCGNDKEISEFERYEKAVENIQAAEVTGAGYEQFKSSLIDAREEAARVNPRAYDHPNLGRPEVIKEDVRYFVMHFTAIPGTRADNYDGMKFASAMGNGNAGALTQYYINFDEATGVSNTYLLTDNFAYHTPKHHEHSFGVEIAGCSQSMLRPAEIANAIYLASSFLIDNGYVNREEPISSVVDEVIKGHRELAPNGHTDWPSAAMDPLRDRIKNFMVEVLGYTA